MATDSNDQNEEQTRKNKKTKKAKEKKIIQEPQKITIELYKYKTLIDALEDPQKVKRVVITVFFLGILLFSGITVITLSIKRLYPYSDITTNGLGATTIKSEKNEVSYWLFNTAILWANSGITVDKGDIITIRTSGKSHTAIHHLYDAAKNNVSKRNDWVGSEGEDDVVYDTATYYRRRFRIFPDMPSGALLMQVVEKGKPIDNPNDGNPDNFYFIGKERQHIYINNSGTLYFTVNDIVLNKPTIASMMWENIRQKYIHNKELTSIDPQIEKYGLTGKVFLNEELHLKASKELKDQETWDSIKQLFEEEFSDKSNDKDAEVGIMRLGHTLPPGEFAYKCELTYYYEKNSEEGEPCKTVWFDDNIGSFLIVIEKTNSGKP